MVKFTFLVTFEVVKFTFLDLSFDPICSRYEMAPLLTWCNHQRTRLLGSHRRMDERYGETAQRARHTFGAHPDTDARSALV